MMADTKVFKNENNTGGQLSSFYEQIVEIVIDNDEPLNEEKEFLETIREQLKKDPVYQNKYVAILNKKIIGTDDNGPDLAIRMYKEHGYVPILVEKVDEDIIYTTSPNLE